MKGIIVISVLVLSVVISAVLFYDKYADEVTDIDLIGQGLTSVDSLVPTNTTIGYQAFPVDIEVFGKARYATAPINIALTKEQPNLDTILTIHKVDDSDSLLKIYLAERHIIYQHVDHKFNYYITTGR